MLVYCHVLYSHEQRTEASRYKREKQGTRGRKGKLFRMLPNQVSLLTEEVVVVAVGGPKLHLYSDLFKHESNASRDGSLRVASAVLYNFTMHPCSLLPLHTDEILILRLHWQEKMTQQESSW